MEVREKKGKLLTKLILIIAGAYLVLSIIQIIVISSFTKSKMRESAERDYTILANQFSSSITSKIGEYYTELAFYTKNHVVNTKDPAQIIKWLQSNADIRPGDFDYVAFVDKNGNFDSDIKSHTTISDRDYFQAIMKQGKNFYIDNPVKSKTSGKSVVHICRPVDVGGERIGFFCAVILADHISHVIDGIHVGKTGIGTLYSSVHEPIATSGDMNNITKSMQNKDETEAFRKRIESFNKKTGVFYSKFGPNNMMMIYSPIENTNWYLTFVMAENEVFETANTTTKLITAFISISAIVLIILFSITIGSAVKPLGIVEKAINDIATGNADLTKRIELKGANNNEIGRVVTGFNKFSEKMQEIISTMKKSKAELDRTGQNLTASTEDTSSAITQIIANIESMGTNINNQSNSVHETAGAVNEIASNIESLNHMIESQGASVTQASAAVEEMIGNINSVNASVAKMAESFRDLEAKAIDGVQKQEEVNSRIDMIASESESLQEANAVISSIAEQTNLLAMNAAIEAAHAGEAGKGFSVVADEIRKLSETSSEQSNSIGEQLKKITEGIEEIVRASKEAADSFALVSTGMNNTNNLVQEIKGAMEEQKEGSIQITDALTNMNDSTAQVKNASEEMAEGNKAILEEVKNLQEATFSMKTGMDEMSIGARKINETGAALSDMSSQMDSSIKEIGEQIDLFKV